MDRFGPRFVPVIYAFAAIGLVSVFSVGVLGLTRLVKFRMGTGSSAEVAAVAAGAAGTAGTSSVSAASPIANPPAEPSILTRRPEPVPTPALPPRPDLAVSVIDSGIIETSTGRFQHADSIALGQQPALVFEVANLGGARSESWQFSVNLPTFAGLYTSSDQQPLAPGERIRFTLGFRDLSRAGQNNADPL